MAHLRKPEPFGRFVLLHHIATGGTAEIYLAQAPADRLLVIKRLREERHRNKRYIALFIDEKRVMSRLDHPNITRMLEYGKVDDRYYIALEHVWGETAATLVTLCAQQRLRFPAGAALYIGAQVAEALDYAHTLRDEHGAPSPVIHRDVTLGNVMLSYEGDVKILDFGIAKAAGRVSRTLLGQVKGTLFYLAPEQVNGEEIGPHTDVYQLGVFLYKTLVGREPFAGDSELQIMEAIAKGQVIPPSTHGRAFPERVERVILRAMARAPDERFSSAGALGAELRKLIGSAYGEGRARLARMVASLTGDRRALQQAYVKQLRAGLVVDGQALDLFRWSGEEESPTNLEAELTAAERPDVKRQRATGGPTRRERTLIDAWTDPANPNAGRGGARSDGGA